MAVALIGVVVNSTPAKLRLLYFLVSLPCSLTSLRSATSQTADQVSTGT